MPLSHYRDQRQAERTPPRKMPAALIEPRSHAQIGPIGRTGSADQLALNRVPRLGACRERRLQRPQEFLLGRPQLRLSQQSRIAAAAALGQIVHRCRAALEATLDLARPSIRPLSGEVGQSAGNCILPDHAEFSPVGASRGDGAAGSSMQSNRSSFIVPDAIHRSADRSPVYRAGGAMSCRCWTMPAKANGHPNSPSSN